MKIKKQMIWVRFTKEGIHKFPAALTEPELSEVKFLGYDHRHIFHFKVGIEVKHDDRDIEFIIFKRWLESLYEDSTLELDFKSCEMISNSLCDAINYKYPHRDITISVSEDNENGSYKEYTNEDI
jgi:hypothetical protein